MFKRWEKVASVGIKGSKIVKIEKIEKIDCIKVIDCKGKHVIPGLIDTQVHFREPGLSRKEDIFWYKLCFAWGCDYSI